MKSVTTVMIKWSALEESQSGLDALAIRDIRSRVPQEVLDSWGDYVVGAHLQGLVGSEFAQGLAKDVLGEIHAAGGDETLEVDLSDSLMTWKYWNNTARCCADFGLLVDGQAWTVALADGTSVTLRLVLDWPASGSPPVGYGEIRPEGARVRDVPSRRNQGATGPRVQG